MLGRGRLVNRIVIIGDRCVAAWGVLRANWINLRVGIAWVWAGASDWTAIALTCVRLRPAGEQ